MLFRSEREITRRRHPKLTDDQLRAAAAALGLQDLLHLYASLAQGDVNVTQVLRALYPDFDERDDSALKASPLERLLERVKSVAPSTRGLRIQGVDGLMVRYAACCQPVPGDRVVGYVTRGRGVSVHRIDCPNMIRLLKDEPERCVAASWDAGTPGSVLVDVDVIAPDRAGLLADVLGVLAREKRSPTKVEAVVGQEEIAVIHLRLNVAGHGDLEGIRRAILTVKGVQDVIRVGGRKRKIGRAHV